MRVALTGGGTGGHIYPGLAIEAALRSDARVRDEPFAARFFGNRRGLEATIVPAAGVDIVYVPSRALQRKASLEAATTAAENARGVAVALRELARFKPDVVIATGGYVCFPVVVAARMLRAFRALHAPLALLEENALPGLTNRLLAPLVDEVWGAFDASAERFERKFVRTGVPVRAAFSQRPAPAQARAQLGIANDARVVLVMGGSQGARSINEAVAALVTRRSLDPSWWIVHVCGERDYAYMQAEQRERPAENRVTLLPYLEDPAPAYAAADLVVARAGASTLAELGATATPSILIPYPFASEDHQAANARMFEAAGAAHVLLDAEVTGDRLWWALVEALRPTVLATLRDAAARLSTGDAAAAIVGRVRALREQGRP